VFFNKRKDQDKEHKPAKRAADKGEVRKGTKSDNAIIRYFQDTGEELRKVAWPTRDEGIQLSTIVLVATLVASLFLGSFDWIIQQIEALVLRG